MSTQSNNSVNSRKRKRNELGLGLEHKQYNGTPVPARKTGRSCSCSRKCFSKFDKNEIQKFVDDFNSLGNQDVQDAHIFGLVSRSTVQRHCS